MKKKICLAIVFGIICGKTLSQRQFIPAEYTSIKKELIKVKGIKDESGISGLSVTDKLVQIFYIDGLGRPLADVVQQPTPVRHDIMQLFAYDALGRVDTIFLPHTSESFDGGFVKRPQHVNEQRAFYADGADRVADDPEPFGVNVFDNSPMNYLIEQGGPGAEWQPGTGHTIRKTFRGNNSNEFRIWHHDLTSPGAYAANELLVEQITDERNSEVVIVKERSGRVVQKHVQVDGSTSLKTLYIYDEKGRIKVILQPEGVNLLGSASTINSGLLFDQAFTFTYDIHNRLVEKKLPGAAAVYYAYDPLDRLVLSQDGNLRTQNKWAYIKYDRNNRPVMQGIYTNATHTSRAAIQQNVLDVLNYSAGETFYEKMQNGGNHGYSNNSFPTTDAEILSVSYYDNYDLDVNGSDDYLYTAQGLADEGTAIEPLGRLTATKVKVLSSSSWIISYIFYDRYGRAIQRRSNNHLSAVLDNLMTKVYDFNGRPVLSKIYHNGGGGNTVTILNRYNYDHAGRLLQVFQKNNNDLEVQVASYRYNDLGQLVSKNLHCTTCTDEIVDPNGKIYAYNITRDEPQATGTELVAHNSVKLLPGFSTATGGTFNARISDPAEQEIIEASQSVQSIDYRYNIRGWLTSINNADLTSDGTINDDTNDFFGIELLYNRTESGLNNQAGDERYWNGNISAIKWKGPGKDAGVAGQRAYRFKYDLANRLESAKFQAIDITTWSTELNAFNELMTYDKNGNIKTLQRNQRKHEWVSTEPAYTSEIVDDLTYSYANSDQSNVLWNVDDEAPAGGGFANGSTSISGQEYIHDAAGNIIKDDNKSITAITYNVLGKADQVTFAGGQTLQYIYDAAGNKLQMVFTDGNSTTTDYVGSFVYEGGMIKYFGSPEGRVVKNTSGQLEYQYAISDHQGNTRVVFSSITPAAYDPVATFGGDPGDESADFQNVDPAGVVSSTAANHTPGGTKVIRMNQNYSAGPTKTLHVYPGDVVDMEVWAYYEGTSGWGSTNTDLATFVTNVAAAFGGYASGTLEQQVIYNSVDAAFGEFGMAGNQGSSRPSAYLNFILFDKDHKLLDMGWTVVPISANGAQQKVTIPSRKIEEHGYMLVYLSYEAESNEYVYFDDFKVTHTKSKVLQYNEYYPFGLQTSTSWTREDHDNSFLFNGGSELNAKAGWYETFFRGYDAALGRFLQVDPHAASYGSWSPYSYGFNDPVFWNDPGGADPQFARFLQDLWNHTSGNKNYSGDAIRTMFHIWSWGGDLNWGAYGSPILDLEFSGGGPGGFVVEYSYLDYSTANENTAPTVVLVRTFVLLNEFEESDEEEQGRTFPEFSTLWNNYPHDVNGEHQHPSSNPLYINQCAIRLSDALVKSGVPLTGYPEEDLDVDHKKWALSANRLKYYLSQNFRDYVKVSQDDFEAKYWNKTGIIYITPPPGGIGHIDLFNKGNTGSGYYLGSQIWFWEIK